MTNRLSISTPIISALVLWNCISLNCNAAIIFETDFAEDGDFYATRQQAQWAKVGANRPKGFDGARVSGNGYIKGMPGEGVDGSVALKFMWDPDLGQPVTQLFKQFPGDKNTGYDDVYVNDLVISTTRIGPDYNVGDPIPEPTSAALAGLAMLASAQGA